MLDVAVIEPPHNEEAITYTEVDPETGHVETQFKPGHCQGLHSPQEKPREDALIPQRVAVKYQRFPLAGS